MKKEVVVIGGGFSGLCVAHFLCEQGWSVTIYEKSDKLGGMISTKHFSHGIVETAANSLIFTPELKDILKKINLEPLFPFSENKKRFIYRGKPRRWPLSFFESTIILKKIALYFLKKTPRPNDSESLDHFLRNHFGSAFSDYLVSPFLSGIYGLSSKNLSAKLIFDSRMSKKRKKQIVSFSEGMGEFTQKLSENLKSRGVRIFLNKEFLINREVSIPHVFCTPANVAEHILEPVYPKVSQALSQIRMISLTTVTLFFKKNKSDLEGFGCLFPQPENFKSLGVLFNNCIFENRSNKRSETWIFGAPFSKKKESSQQEDLKEIVLQERFRAFGKKSQPLDFFVSFWPKALPAYDNNLRKTQADLKDLPDNVYLCGNYLNGIGLSSVLNLCSKLAKDMKVI